MINSKVVGRFNMKLLSHYCNKLFTGTLFYLLTLGMMSPAFSSGDILVRGYLVGEPCTLMEEDESIVVEFGTVIDKYLYLNTKTHPESFQIRLIDCDLTDSPKVKVMFSGAENSSLPGYLALDSGSMASSVAIGILDENSELIPINSETKLYPLTDETNTLNFKGFVIGEPDAIKNKTIALGPFSATAIFTLIYD